jgi:hypothetical protein
MKLTPFFLLLVIVLIGCHSTSQEEKPSSSKNLSVDLIDKNVDLLLQDTLINSLSIAIYYKGEEIIKHYGELDKG